ncbi:protein kinase [Streptomyces sp. NPDC052052]|uniref:serine/threonine-protein kinase n=1 Tax=Streptomyces sp. NPDC052052 TaxID=3154756 RepID=UPI0034136EB1
MTAQQPGGGAGVPGAEDATVPLSGGTDPTAVLPATIGPYVVMRELGGGGMGVVSLCRTTSGRLVAVKQVREEYADDPAFRSRFRREVAAARRVSGVYTVPVVDADTEGPRPWIATSYMPAPTLDQAVRLCGSFQEPALRALGTALAEALQVIHAAGVVHRDVKPGNVLLAPDGPLVIDFGISRALESGETRVTGTGTAIGSPAFMAPEQIVSSHDTGPAADVFALAGVLVYAACGEGPFGPGGESSLHRIMTAEPDLHGVPGALHGLLTRCLDKSPSRRPGLAEILAGLAPADPAHLHVPALRAEWARRSQEAELLAVAPPPPARPPGDTVVANPGRRKLLIGSLAALGVVAAGSGLAAYLTGGSDGTPKAKGDGKPLGSDVRTVKLTDPPRPLWSKAPPLTITMPLLYSYGQTLLLHEGGYAAAALATADGTVRWQHGSLPSQGGSAPGKDPIGVGGWVLGPVEGGILVSSMSTALGSAGRYFLSIVDPATARVKSKAALGASESLVSLLATHGSSAYCLSRTLSGGFNPASPSATPGYSSAQYVIAVDVKSGRILWRRPVTSSSLYGIRYAADGYGFYYTEDTDAGLTIHALNAASGKSRWSMKVPADPDSNLPAYMQSAGGQLTSSLAAAGDLLLTVNVKGGLAAYDAKTGTRRWSVPMTAATKPSVVGDLVLTNDLTQVHAVELRTGKVRWSITSPVTLSPGMGSGPTLAASKDVTAVLFTPLSYTATRGASTDGPAGALVLRTSDGTQLWALREKAGSASASAAASAAPSPSASSGIGSPAARGTDIWAVAVQDDLVFLAGGERVRVYRAAAGT